MDTFSRRMSTSFRSCFFLFLLLVAGCQRHPNAIPVMLPEEQHIVDATNAARAEHGLLPLEVDIKLCTAAGEHARNMAGRNRLSHELPISGARTLIQRVGSVQYQWSSLGENIAWNYSVEDVVVGWMDSAGHRRNILGKYTQIGVVFAIADDGSYYYCQVFATPR